MKLSSDYDEILSHIEELHKKARCLQAKAMAKSDLTFNEFSLLQLIDEREDGVTQAEAAGALLVDKALISRSVHSLEKKGLLAAVQNPSCRREKRLTLTDEAQKILPRLAAGHREGVAMLFDEIEKEELEQFGLTLDKILKKMSWMGAKDNG